MWKIKTALEKDIQAIALDLGGRLAPDRRPVFEDKAARYIRKPDRSLFIALDDSRVIGFSTIIENPKIKGALSRKTVDALQGLAMITGLLVEGDYRRQGIGQALVRAMEDWAFRRGRKGIWLVTRQQAAWYRRHFGYEAMEAIISEGIQKTIMVKIKPWEF
ncbi:MAG: GNAT family N-acetyltransferase [Desulfococcaceae bacterium]